MDYVRWALARGWRFVIRVILLYLRTVGRVLALWGGPGRVDRAGKQIHAERLWCAAFGGYGVHREAFGFAVISQQQQVATVRADLKTDDGVTVHFEVGDFANVRGEDIHAEQRRLPVIIISAEVDEVVVLGLRNQRGVLGGDHHRRRQFQCPTAVDRR